jgi:radical SAM superfamily enzyme YgiQ (UPF0313 family)
VKIHSVQLVNAPNESVVHKSGSASYYPHLGLTSIATYLSAADPACPVEIIDGSITGLGEILSRLSADLVGISVLTPTYLQALEIARAAKGIGAVTVLGNDHATNLYENILRLRTEVDFVICGDHGEDPLWQLVRYLRGEIHITSVPNLAYRAGNSIMVNKAQRGIVSIGGAGDDAGQADLRGFKRYSLGSIGIPNRDLIEKRDVYFDNYNRDYGKFHGGIVRQTTINLARGCGWGESEDRRCTFCDIYDLSMRAVTPKRAWQEVRYLVKECGYTFLYEVCDSFSSFAIGSDSFVDRLIESRPEDLGPEWFVYARATELYRPAVIQKLKDLNVRRVNIGIDAADDSMLRLMSKGASERINRLAVESCAKAGLQMYMSFVFGGIGETAATLERTYEFVEFAAQSGYLVAVDPSVLLPLPNAPAWRYLMDQPVGRSVAAKVGIQPRYECDFLDKYSGMDLLPTDELARDWVKTFCRCTYEDILRVRDDMIALQKDREFVFGGFGVRGF